MVMTMCKSPSTSQNHQECSWLISTLSRLCNWEVCDILIMRPASVSSIAMALSTLQPEEQTLAGQAPLTGIIEFSQILGKQILQTHSQIMPSLDPNPKRHLKTSPSACVTLKSAKARGPALRATDSRDGSSGIGIFCWGNMRTMKWSPLDNHGFWGNSRFDVHHVFYFALQSFQTEIFHGHYSATIGPGFSWDHVDGTNDFAHQTSWGTCTDEGWASNSHLIKDGNHHRKKHVLSSSNQQVLDNLKKLIYFHPFLPLIFNTPRNPGFILDLFVVEFFIGGIES